ncbi:MAG: sulfurtransferase complex subunit TusC [Proteobacteria bacterium]|nr:sulfurtransferase complex subunit TusC [Pseudomonadota bacterium]
MTEDNNVGQGVKKIAHLIRRAPHGTIYAYEGLESVLIMAAYDQDISMIFVDDGVFSLKKGQDTAGIGTKGFSKTLAALKDYEVEKLYVDRISLEERGLTQSDLLVEVEVLESVEIAGIMAEQDAVVEH